jgi:hypothetical protein
VQQPLKPCPAAHLLVDGGDLLRCGGNGWEEADRPVVAGLEHPVEDAAMAHRQWREDVIDQVRRGLCHPPGVAGKSHQEAVPALGTSGAGKTIGTNAAFWPRAYSFSVCRS